MTLAASQYQHNIPVPGTVLTSSMLPDGGHLGKVDAFWVHPRRALEGLYYCTKFDWNCCSSFGNTKLHVWHENAYSCPKNLKWSVFG